MSAGHEYAGTWTSLSAEEKEIGVGILISTICSQVEFDDILCDTNTLRQDVFHVLTSTTARRLEE